MNELDEFTLKAIARRIKTRRLDLGLSYQELADKTAISKSTLQRYETGFIKNLPIDKCTVIADALQTTPAYLMGWEEEMKVSSESVSFQVIGEVAAGFGSEAIEELTGDSIEIPTEWLSSEAQKNFFVLRIKGQSMYPDFQHGDYVLVHRQPQVENGEIAVVIYGDEEATLKKIKRPNAQTLQLIPRNPEYTVKEIKGAELARVRIAGQVRKLIRNIGSDNNSW